MNSTEVQNPQRKLDMFCSCLCKTCYVFQKLSLALRTLSLSFVTNNSSLDSKAFLCFIAFSGSPTVVHHAFLFFNAKAWQQSQTDLFTYTTVSHCGHTFHGIRYTVGIPSEPLVKDSHKHLSSTEKPQYGVFQLMWSHIYCYVCVTERYTETLHIKKMADLVTVSLLCF